MGYLLGQELALAGLCPSGLPPPALVHIDKGVKAKSAELSQADPRKPRPWDTACKCQVLLGSETK